MLHALPVYHTHGLFTATNTVIFSGGQLLLFRRKFSADDIMAQMPEATTMMGVPTRTAAQRHGKSPESLVAEKFWTVV